MPFSLDVLRWISATATASLYSSWSWIVVMAAGALPFVIVAA
jgi:hypothetical protein